MTGILQITDIHIASKGKLASGRLNTRVIFEKLVTRIKQIRKQIEPVSAVLISGDLSDDGSAESYEFFKSTMASVELPVFVIPGNHDHRETMRKAFKSDCYLPGTGKLNWHQQLEDIDLIGLDTLVEGQSGGVLDAATIKFLKGALDAAGQRPVLLALHHPPFDCGIKFMDEIGLDGTEALANLLQNHKGDVQVVCGHIHSMIIASVGSTVAISAPSPCSSFAFDTRDDAPVGFFEQEDGFLFHRWRHGFQSVRIAFDHGRGPFPF